MVGLSHGSINMEQTAVACRGSNALSIGHGQQRNPCIVWRETASCSEVGAVLHVLRQYLTET